MTDAEKRRKDEETLLFGLLSLLARDTNHHLRELVQGYLDGTTSLTTLSQSLVAALQDSHGHASFLGKRLAGKRQPFGHSDNMAGLSVAIGQQKYLSGLLTDLATGRYVKDGVVSAQLWQRLTLYAMRLRGTANEAWVRNLPHDTMLNWILGEPETHHCQTCPQRAAAGPYAAGSVMFQPGDGSSECGVMCLCEWQIIGGGRGFPPLDL